MERFEALLPQLARVEPLGTNGETGCWKAYDQSGKLIGYAFAAIVPEAAVDADELLDMDDMDRYQIVGVVDPVEYKVLALDIALDPAGLEKPWEIKITEPEFERQYLGLAVEEICLSPDGKIDAITDATLSSNWVTDAVRQKIAAIIDMKTGDRATTSRHNLV